MAANFMKIFSHIVPQTETNVFFVDEYDHSSQYLRVPVDSPSCHFTQQAAQGEDRAQGEINWEKACPFASPFTPKTCAMLHVV